MIERLKLRQTFCQYVRQPSSVTYEQTRTKYVRKAGFMLVRSHCWRFLPRVLPKRLEELHGQKAQKKCLHQVIWCVKAYGCFSKSQSDQSGQRVRYVNAVFCFVIIHRLTIKDIKITIVYTLCKVLQVDNLDTHK